MGRIVKTGSAGKDRVLLEKGIAIAIRELAEQQGMDENTLDLLAYIAFSLRSISLTIDSSVEAWEKRGYWIKADRYRLEWNWAGNMGDELRQAIQSADWGEVARIIAQVSQKLSKVKISQHNRLGSPWTGSYNKLMAQNH